GIDGCGKSTQAALLSNHRKGLGWRVTHTREPGGAPLGGALREILLHQRAFDLGLETEALLMAADRADHVATVIRPALLRGEAVVCERYTDSTEAYQGYGLESGEATLQGI